DSDAQVRWARGVECAFTTFRYPRLFCLGSLSRHVTVRPKKAPRPQARVRKGPAPPATRVRRAEGLGLRPGAAVQPVAARALGPVGQAQQVEQAAGVARPATASCSSPGRSVTGIISADTRVSNSAFRIQLG